MSTAVIARPGIPRLAAVELRKSADTRAGFWLLVVIVLLAAALVTLSLVFGEEADHNLSTLLSDSVQVISIVLPVLGILLVTSEWSQRTGLSTFALVPQRERIVVAKTIGATILTLCAVAACLVIAALGTAIAGGSWNLGLGELGRYTLFELITMLGGVAFGLAFMNSALAIVMYFVIPIALVDPRRDHPRARQARRLARPRPADVDPGGQHGDDDRHELGPARDRHGGLGRPGVGDRTGQAPAHRAQVGSRMYPRGRGPCPVRARSLF